ncbi:MAG: hypothetical protein BMS9Abin37_0125 [Acidobacteriota bacterium]|nr:MAG: hypothetical protein BMS9Abin37_0125 [Acidobacteriota bacterium]
MVSRNTIALALVTGLLIFASTAALYQRHSDIVVDIENAYEGGMVSEFHNRERLGDQFFRWTKDVSYLDFRNLPTTGELAVEARLRVRRPHGEPLPNLAFTANGATVHNTRGLPGTVSYRFEFPADRSHLRLGIRSDTFDPNGERRLGVQVLGVTVRLPDAPLSWAAPSAVMGGAAVLLFATALVALGAGGASLPSAGVALLVSGGFVYLLAQHAVRFSLYPWQVAALSALTLVVALVARRLQRDPRRSVTSAIAIVFVLEMAVAFYPLTVSSDAHFQANRMRHFLEGDWHPESVTQHDPPFRIPYPVSLYVVSAPLVGLGLERATALTATTSAFDVLVSILLIVLAWRFLDDVRGGVLAAVLYQLSPMNALSFSAGNFTNLFAVAMLTLAFTFLLTRPIACALFTTLALTAHFGMLLEGVILWPVWLAVLWLGPTPVKDDRKRLTIALAVSFVIVGVYYLGYAELVTDQWGRALTEGSSGGAGGTGGWRATGSQLGWVFLAVAALGSLSLVQSRQATTFRSAALVWLGVSILFLGIDLVSAFEIRYALQALPLLALLGGCYLSSALDRGRVGIAAAWAAILYIGVMGVRTLHDVALVRYH